MMRFSSYHSLSAFAVLLFCQSAAAAILAVSPAQHERLEDSLSKRTPSNPIDCPGSLPPYFPQGCDYPPFFSLYQICAAVARHINNLECTCYDSSVLCGKSTNPAVIRLLEYCWAGCRCRDPQPPLKTKFTIDLDERETSRSSTDRAGDIIDSPNYIPKMPLPRHVCKGSCTSVSRGCAWHSTGDCICFTPPISFFFWFKALCGPSLSGLPRRDLQPERDSYLKNLTAHFAGGAVDHATDYSLAAQLASGLLPSPCNESYVSYACATSRDGIVHEPLTNWSGAVLPQNVSVVPPVPVRFLEIHGLRTREGEGEGEGNSVE